MARDASRHGPARRDLRRLRFAVARSHAEDAGQRALSAASGVCGRAQVLHAPSLLRRCYDLLLRVLDLDPDVVHYPNSSGPGLRGAGPPRLRLRPGALAPLWRGLRHAAARHLALWRRHGVLGLLRSAGHCLRSAGLEELGRQCGVAVGCHRGAMRVGPLLAHVLGEQADLSPAPPGILPLVRGLAKPLRGVALQLRPHE
mmetsp:Transcript_48450/g.149691  ORF Transcript_48450/g.149691 Transcript_48450/m.149691 type:complete len:200 (-) Transcript_48450:587-1186(-)